MAAAKKKSEETTEEVVVSTQAQFSTYNDVSEKTDGPPLGRQVEQVLGTPRED